ncbi:DUF1330 domain-containing protein [Rhodobacteraceae bacterium 2CG4]|uniref:DUF1330 domain-containing protein n=1 Tax=Halovulum marinum TaxID=2662447 RepID=A0A6L5Z5W2_9RHOB|nr:DUF1330 domain-containing protein [Halovulum marinum]MSU91434.1 DUF1330 domain-containing protein [Halovulum marinum]
MAAYLIAQITVDDPDEYVKYASQTVALAAEFGGRFLAKGGGAEQLEGSGPERNVIIEFPDRDAALRWYRSDAYQALAAIRRRAASVSNMVVVDGV